MSEPSGQVMQQHLQILKQRKHGDGTTISRKRRDSSGGPRRRHGKSYEEEEFQKLRVDITDSTSSYGSSVEPSPAMVLPTMGGSLLRSPSQSPPVSPEPLSLCSKTVLRKVHTL